MQKNKLNKKEKFYFHRKEIREIFSVLIFSLEDEKNFSEKFLENKVEKFEENFLELEKIFLDK